MREITNPKMLRAMAHPLRLKMLNELAVHGPATATALAEKLGDSAANCSWHLRQLAKFGFVEDLPAPGRNRPWRWIPIGNRWHDSTPEVAQAAAQLTATLLDYELAQRNAWDANEPGEPREWREAAFTMQSATWLTAQELAEVNAKVSELLLMRMDRLVEPATRPPDSRPVRFIAWGIPCDLS
jgi:DNA-binding transcriptional ArsR family regulator